MGVATAWLCEGCFTSFSVCSVCACVGARACVCVGGGVCLCGRVCVCLCVGFVMCGCFGNVYAVSCLRFFLP